LAGRKGEERKGELPTSTGGEARGTLSHLDRGKRGRKGNLLSGPGGKKRKRAPVSFSHLHQLRSEGGKRGKERGRRKRKKGESEVLRAFLLLSDLRRGKKKGERKGKEKESSFLNLHSLEKGANARFLSFLYLLREREEKGGGGEEWASLISITLS